MTLSFGAILGFCLLQNMLDVLFFGGGEELKMKQEQLLPLLYPYKQIKALIELNKSNPVKGSAAALCPFCPFPDLALFNLKTF